MMIDINKTILNDHKSTLKDTSKDTSDARNIAYMTQSEIEVIDFDGVKGEYISKLKLSSTPTSNDALIINNIGDSVFIEFKNGALNTQKKEADVRKKIYDSVLILTDIIGEGISFTRKHLDYILVYNGEKNPESEEQDSKTAYRESQSRNKIAKNLSALGKEHYIRYGLEAFKGYCFRNVYTYTESEFEKEFVSSLQ